MMKKQNPLNGNCLPMVKKTTNQNEGGKLTKQENVLQWQLDLQNYIQKWLDSILRN